MPSGGARPNSGPERGTKHKKTIEIEMARQIIKERVFANLEPIIEAQIDLAKGHLVEEYIGEGKRIYSKSPDKGAAELLLNQTIGKPKESIDVTGGMTIELTNLKKQLKDFIHEPEDGENSLSLKSEREKG